MLQSKVETRLAGLIDAGEKLKGTKAETKPHPRVIREVPVYHVDEDGARQWTMNVLTILESAFGKDSEYYQQVKARLPHCCEFDRFCANLSYLKAALGDWKGSYFFDRKALLEAEVFGDLLEQAEELLKLKYKDAAAVLIGGVLEEHLRSMCVRRGIALQKPNGERKTMNALNDDLAKADAYNPTRKKQITAWAGLRNDAAHGHWKEYSQEQVETFWKGVSDFRASVS